MKVGLKTVLIQSRESHWGKVEDYWYVFLPLASDGVVVVSKESKWVYDLIDGRRTFEEVLRKVIEEDKNAKEEDLKKILTDLVDKGVIEIKGQERKDFIEKKPRVFEVWMHVTNQCNLRCKYCYVKKTNETMSREKMWEIGRKVLKMARKNGFLKVKFKLSGGESLLRLQEVILFVEEMRSSEERKGLKVDFVVMTNGVLLTDKIAKKLKKMRIRAAVSLDGLEKYHDLQRVFADGSGSFLLVKKGIENLQKNKVLFNVSVTVTKHNVENLPDLADFLLKKEIPFAFNFYRDIGVGEKLEASKSDLVKYLTEAYRRIELKLPRYKISNGLLDGVVIGKPHKHVCGMGRSYVAIDMKGRVFGCQMMMGEERGLEDKDVMKAMKKSDFTDGKGVENKSECLSCPWRYVCCGGCPLLSRERKGDWKHRSPYCEVYRKMLPDLVRLEAKRLIKWGVKKT